MLYTVQYVNDGSEVKVDSRSTNAEASNFSSPPCGGSVTLKAARRQDRTVCVCHSLSRSGPASSARQGGSLLVVCVVLVCGGGCVWCECVCVCIYIYIYIQCKLQEIILINYTTHLPYTGYIQHCTE